MLAAMALMVTLFAGVAYAATIEVRGALLSNVEDTLESRVEIAAKSIRSGETLQAEDFQTLTLDGVFVIVRDEMGNVLYPRKDPYPPEALAKDRVWRKALRRDSPAKGTTEVSSDDPVYIYAVPVDPPRGDARVVEAGKSYEAALEGVRDVAVTLATGIGVAFLLSIAAAYLLARTALR